MLDAVRLSKAPIRCLTTGVPGLDTVLGGGLPEFSFNLLAGPPGSGKTTLAHQIMFARASPTQPALYLTALGEPPLKMLRYQQQFDFFNLDQLNQSIRFVNLAEDMTGGDLDRVMARMAAEVESHEPHLVFVDSFSSVMQAASRAGGSRLSLPAFIQNLGVLMTSWQATTFLIGEFFSQAEPNPVLTVADGLIGLSQHVQGNSVVRKMEVVKMRGRATLPGLHTFRIGTQGIQVFAPPALQPAQAVTTPPPRPRMKMGIDALDEMLGGGLPAGYSLLVAGPSGSGKSILAAAFLVQGGHSGETGVIAAFEQRTPHARGAELAALVERGQVGVVDTHAPNLSVDEVAALIIAEVQRLRATRVVIDSLSGFELALAPTFRADFREALSRLVQALASTGVNVLMTSELEDRYTDLRFSPYGTAFLTDAIVVQRYVEIDSRMQRMLAVVKVRASPHSDALRLFHIDEQGIHIDEMLSGHDGLLTGHAGRRAAS